MTHLGALSISDGIGAYISSGHRLHKLAEGNSSALYSQEMFDRRALYLSIQFWKGTVLPALQLSINERVSRRLIAAAQRAKSNSNLYGRKIPGPSEICTEVFFDTQICRPNEAHISRQILHEKIRKLVKEKHRLKIGLPLFSRKPISPIKNRGYLPDLAEMASIARCYEIALILSAVYQDVVEFAIYADGKKYRRACQTPNSMIDNYQDGLKDYVVLLKASSLVQVVDYEEQVCAALGYGRTCVREDTYNENYANLCRKYAGQFNPSDLRESLKAIETKDDLGRQVAYTFNSLAYSVFYRSGNLGDKLIQNNDAAQSIYSEYIKTLFINPHQEDCDFYIDRTGISRRDFVDLILRMRWEAWYATLKYVAISTTDRCLDVWKELNPGGVKFTIHAKPGEISFVHTSSECKSMTAQHCVGGMKPSKGGLKVTFEYRLAREANGECPVLLGSTGIGNPKDITVLEMLMLTGQPLFYMSEHVDDLPGVFLNKVLQC